MKPTAKKLSYKLQRELEELPAKMEQLEQDIESLQVTINDADFYNQDPAEVTKQLNLLADKELLLETYFERWEELESLK